jgi:TldD protein
VPDDLRAHEAELSAALRRIEPRTTFAEILAQRTAGLITNVDRRQSGVSSMTRLLGATMRVWAGDRWSEAATTRVDATGLRGLVDGLQSTLSRRTVRTPPPGVSSTVVAEWVKRPSRPLRDITPEEQLARTRTLYGWAMNVKGVSDARAGSGWSEDERLYLNTAGARCYSVIGRAGAYLTPIAIENGRVAYDHTNSMGTGGWERVDLITEAATEALARTALALLTAGTPPSGETNVVLDPGLTGTFVHESFGHGTEADQFVRDRSYLAAVRGTVVGPEALTIVDDGTLAGGHGTIGIDDEGHRAQKTTLIDKGRFVGVLHDRETAAALGDRPTGNARRADVTSRLYVRMTNTYLVPGTQSLEELIQEARDGILLERWTSGVEDPLGGLMQLKALRGRIIRHGELTDLVGSMALSGRVLQFLKNIRGIGRGESFLVDPGFCGKGHTDLLPVGSGGSYLLSRAIVGPA